jgi:hypothetical protein
MKNTVTSLKLTLNRQDKAEGIKKLKPTLPAVKSEVKNVRYNQDYRL